MIVRCELKSKPEPFLVVVNHWKSRLGVPAIHNADRLETADWLGDYLANRSTDMCALVLGDFNAEPFEPPFSDLRLRGRRTFSNALWSNATPAYLYNTAWKIMTEPENWEVAGLPGYVESRPKTTHGDAGANVFDHLLVSGRALRNGPLTLLENTLNLFRHNRTLKQSPKGVLRPASGIMFPRLNMKEVPITSRSSQHLPSIRRRIMSVDSFDRQLDKALDFAATANDPFGKSYEELKQITNSIERKLNNGLPGDPIKVEIEPGFQATMGQQQRVIIRIPAKNYRDTLFRAYIPTGGMPIHLDLYGEEPERCGDLPELQHKILDFLGQIKDRMASYREYARQ